MQIACGNGRDVILQAFHWNLVKTQGTGTMDGRPETWYQLLLGQVERIAELGFSVVYLPPPWVDDSEWYADGKHGGGEGYFWRDFDLNSRYGSKTQLRELVTALHGHGLKAIVDLVPNHRDRERMRFDRWSYPGPCWRVGGGDTGGGFLDGRYDLNLAHPAVVERVRWALDELMDDCGVDGWRWDFVWGYAVEDVVGLIRDTQKVEYLSIGEYWQSSSEVKADPMIARYGQDEGARILGWARDSGGCAFDIFLKREIQTGNAAYLKNSLVTRVAPMDRGRLVTYVDTHDTGASPWSAANGWGQKHWECPPDFKSCAYAFILCMPGIPSVYWPDCFDWGFEAQIEALLAARKRAGIAATSEWIDLTGEHSGFAAYVCDGLGKPHLALSLRSDWLGPAAEEGWTVVFEKAGEWTVWEKPRAYRGQRDD